MLAPVVLEGSLVRLEPLAERHVAGLRAAAQDPAIWRWIALRVESEADVRGLVELAARSLVDGTGIGFAQLVPATGEVMGSTSYLAADLPNRRIEIGATWLHPRFQGSGVNAEAKLLLMRHAFETLGCRRVEFKTDSQNRASRAALVRIGATEEGTLRAHMVRLDGSRRDSVYFSVIAPEWPQVREHLESLLARSAPRA